MIIIREIEFEKHNQSRIGASKIITFFSINLSYFQCVGMCDRNKCIRKSCIIFVKFII